MGKSDYKASISRPIPVQTRHVASRLTSETKRLCSGVTLSKEIKIKLQLVSSRSYIYGNSNKLELAEFIFGLKAGRTMDLAFLLQARYLGKSWEAIAEFISAFAKN